MIKWNKKLKAKMWAEMISDNIKRREEVNFTKTLTKHIAIIGGVGLFFMWSIYFIYGI